MGHSLTGSDASLIYSRIIHMKIVFLYKRALLLLCPHCQRLKQDSVLFEKCFL